MNPRYVAYASENGRTPEDQLAFDREAWPGGCMAPFMIWISGKLRAFRKTRPECFMRGGALADHVAFDEFIKAQKRDHQTIDTASYCGPKVQAGQHEVTRS